jgi:hypothetical protein
MLLFRKLSVWAIFFLDFLKSWRISYKKSPLLEGMSFFIRRGLVASVLFHRTTDAWLFKDWFGISKDWKKEVD